MDVTQQTVSLNVASCRVDVPNELAEWMMTCYETIQRNQPGTYKSFEEYVVSLIEGGIYGGS